MSRLQQVVPRCLISITVIAVLLLPQCDADVGTASHYDPPYTPTACFGYDPLQFPSSFLFAAAGEGIWDNGAACGRQYWVRCISADRPKTCNPAQLVQVRIVDRALSAVSRSSSDRATIVLSKTAFEAIANPSASSVNVEFVQV
ncbi:EG45-like domain containing protein isoform X1 [Syzygium oleosum]|uniref:EG45-like domain containing protein isoform X1 n=1 Tax=Syzygium oleosum TaxID=219896 RepID=UPI0024B9DF19|nr:EG45-like domain containing protein isoform X1 [Syzygium oleosum]XP_056174878.1 EG45-like domain containing protein isoform X1 [Syzygium oleosum]XP_056174879.1 EG45-like domain containing protein isoform X1 [Syzygium oleosum]